MNIAFDAVALLGPMSKNRGIGNYAESQFKAMIREDKNNRYFFFNVFEKTDIFSREIEEGLLTEDDFLITKDGSLLSSPLMRSFYGALIRSYIRKNHIDVFYVTSPFDGHVPTYQKEWFTETRTVVTVYDVIPYVMKEQYLSNTSDVEWYMQCVDSLRWADRLLVISQSVKDDLCRYLKFSPDNIDVIWGAPGAMFREIAVSAEEKEKLYEKFGIDSPYVMCTGGDDERKNIAGLIEAFGKLPQELTAQHQLVIVCKLQKASVERYTKLARSLKIGGRVVLTNFVSNEELLQLYNLAELTAFPSKYEGFGLPVVESWACGTPVLTSNNSSLVQIAGDAAILVDPFSVEDVSRGLREALTGGHLPELTKLGQERLRQFQWEQVAHLAIESIERVTPRTAAPECEKLAFFTPLPPVQSGISDYSVDILTALSQYFAGIDVYIDKGYTPDCALPDNISVFPHKDYERKREAYADTVFQVGNSTYHTYMWPYIQKYGGTMVLHDYNLHGVAYAAAMNIDRSSEKYRTILHEDFNSGESQAIFTALESGNWAQLTQAEVNGFLTNYADKIIVHSQEAQRKLLERDAGRTVFHIHSYAKIEPLIDTVAAKRALDIAEDAFVFAAFGHVHETKRALPILEAFAKVSAGSPNARLIFVGKLDAALKDTFPKLVSALHLEDKVQVTGYTELEQFRQYIDATDVCLNLRWPYNGETSGSLMRILAKGKCVVVNNIGSFAEIPDDACVKLPSAEKMSGSEEVTAIAEAMNDLLLRPETRQTLSRNARRFAEEHLDLKLIAKQYAEVIRKKPVGGVSEELLRQLRAECKEKKMTNGEMCALAKALAYTK